MSSSSLQLDRQGVNGGRLCSGHAPTQFNGDRGPGRIWPRNEAALAAKSHGPDTIDALAQMAGDKSVNAYFRLQAIDTLLSYGFGTPSVASIVRYEVDLILAKLGLPQRSKLRDKEGKPIFGRLGGFKPTVKNVQQIHQQPRDNDQLKQEAIDNLNPLVLAYSPGASLRDELNKLVTKQQISCSQTKADIEAMSTDLRTLHETWLEECKILEFMVAHVALQPDTADLPLSGPRSLPEKPDPSPSSIIDLEPEFDPTATCQPQEPCQLALNLWPDPTDPSDDTPCQELPEPCPVPCPDALGEPPQATPQALDPEPATHCP